MPCNFTQGFDTVSHISIPVTALLGHLPQHSHFTSDSWAAGWKRSVTSTAWVGLENALKGHCTVIQKKITPVQSLVMQKSCSICLGLLLCILDKEIKRITGYVIVKHERIT